jgi:O-antigen/teichoic acid export membrane protein
VTSLKFAGALAHVAVCAYCLLVLGIREPDFYILTLIITNMAFAVVAVAGSGVVLRSWSRTLLRSLYRHGAYVTAIAALATVLFGIDMIFLNHWTTPGDVGVYSVYNGFPKRLLGVVFTEGIGLVLLPSLATMDKPALLRRIGRIAPVLGVSTTIFSLAASALFFLPLGAEYSYSIGLMALSAVGIGAHTVYNLYYFALSMDGLRGAKVVILCLASGLPVAISCQAAFIYWWGVVGALIAFALTNLIILALVIFASARVYRLAGRTRTQEATA